MRLTLDLPDQLVKQVKLRTTRDGRRFGDVVARLLRLGLAAESTVAARPAVIRGDPMTGLPVIQCRHAARPHERLTAEGMDDILLGQEVEWHKSSNRSKRR